MSDAVRSDAAEFSEGLGWAPGVQIHSRIAAFEAPFGATSGAQDAPRAWIANSCLLAMTRLASPNRLNSCASFLARPL